MKKMLVSFLATLALIFSYQFLGQQVVYAGTNLAYLDEDYNVCVFNVYKKSDVNIDTEVQIIIRKNGALIQTHLEFIESEKGGKWLYRAHNQDYTKVREWKSVWSNKLAWAVLKYACDRYGIDPFD